MKVIPLLSAATLLLTLTFACSDDAGTLPADPSDPATAIPQESMAPTRDFGWDGSTPEPANPAWTNTVPEDTSIVYPHAMTVGGKRVLLPLEATITIAMSDFPSTAERPITINFGGSYVIFKREAATLVEQHVLPEHAADLAPLLEALHPE